MVSMQQALTGSERRRAAVRRMDELIRQDPGARGLASRAGPNPLAQAAASLASSRKVLIATGFCVRSSMIGETDGPPGAAVLADALAVLGVDVGIVTDRHSASLVRAACASYGRPVPIFEVPLPQREADAFLGELVAGFCPTHIVAIERPGSASDGSRYSMRGENLDDIVPGFDSLFSGVGMESATAGSGSREWVTVAIGDGGNELGMGSLPAGLKEGVVNGDLIFAREGADFPLVAGVSNWGGWALAAATLLTVSNIVFFDRVVSGGATRDLSVSGSHSPDDGESEKAASDREDEESSRPGAFALRDADIELEVLKRLLALGSVDGATKTRSMTVDGLPLETYLGVIRGICAEYREAFV